jgi:type II secretory pathway pseudopilin PulG
MQKRRSSAGFTLTEMLVVVAVTIIMMGLLLGPLAQTFNLTSQGRTMIAAQDNARVALQQLSRDMQDAMFVYDGLPLNLWHYSEYESSLDEPSPTADAVAVPYTVSGAMMDMVLPRMRFFCLQFNHYLNVVEPSRDGSQIDTRRVAIDTCPRPGHEASAVELRPTDPLQPEEVRVRYFIGLRQPTVDQTEPNATLPGSTSDRSNPHYVNGFLFRNTAAPSDNMYVLYRVEFDPRVDTTAGFPTRNWLLANGRPNPNFFYDAAFAPEWKSRAVALVTGEDTDLVRMVRVSSNMWQPQPTVRFGATAIPNEALNPNAATGTFELEGIESAPRSPTAYAADFGNWAGPASDMSTPLTDSVIMAPQRPLDAALLSRYVSGPRIQVFERVPRPMGGDRLVRVFDSAASAAESRRRLFAWDSRRGVVNFALRRIEFPAPASGDQESFSATVLPAYTVDLKEDMSQAEVTSFAGMAETVPTGFGRVKTIFPWARIVPGSETVMRLVDTGSDRSVLLERVGFTGLGLAGGDQYVAQADLEPNQYTIDYSTGIVTLSDQDPSLLDARPGGPQQLLVRYQFQTNLATDVVRASYSTSELMTAQVGLLQYEPRSGEPEPIQLTKQVRIRNTGR